MTLPLMIYFNHLHTPNSIISPSSECFVIVCIIYAMNPLIGFV